MTKDETIAWVKVEANATEYIRGFKSPREGARQYEILADLVESGHVTAAQLPEYGFPMPGDPPAAPAATTPALTVGALVAAIAKHRRDTVEVLGRTPGVHDETLWRFAGLAG